MCVYVLCTVVHLHRVCETDCVADYSASLTEWTTDSKIIWVLIGWQMVQHFFIGPSDIFRIEY